MRNENIKCVRDGKVAVLYSPGFGAGWSTWAEVEDKEGCLFDYRIVEAVESGMEEGALEKLVRELYPELYLGGLRDLTIKWLPVGTAFRIDEYDGSESVEICGDVDWIIA